MSGVTALVGAVALGYAAHKYGWSFSNSTVPEASWAVVGAFTGGAIGYTVAENNIRYAEAAADVVPDDESPIEPSAVVAPAREIATAPQSRPQVPMELAQYLVFDNASQGTGGRHASE
jgi:hypothetical protein